MNWLTRLLHLKRRRAKTPYSSFCIKGKLPHGQHIIVMDRELRGRGSFNIYLN